MRGKTIRHFLIDGQVDGRWASELSNWIGKAYKIPRTYINQCTDRDDLSNTGMYFLFGRNDEAGEEQVYIGEAENIFNRLKQHLSEKDFWTECIVFISKDNNLNKAHIKYLENYLYILAKESKRYEVVNSNVPTEASISEMDRAEMDEFIDNMRLILGVLGHKILEPSIKRKSDEKENLYILQDRTGIKASGKPISEGFAVLKGSKIADNVRITKFMMIALLIIMLVLAVNSIFMSGGEEGLAFYLIPDVQKMIDAGIVNVIVAAMNQAFFTLSLGIGAMAIFGSYIGKERALLGEAVNVAFLDTFVAFVSGLIIFPACFANGVQPDSGPSLIFITLPNIFNNIPLGRLWGSLFFIFMSFASLSTIFAVFEGIIASTMDISGWSRRKTCLVNGIMMFVLSLPCALGFNLLNGIQPFGDGSTIMDLEDFLVSNIILPIGSMMFVLFCVSKKGWGWDKFVDEANTGKGLKIKKYMRSYMTYVLPVIVFIVFVLGLYNFFN